MENILSEIQKLRELIDQSETVILINLDSQRNVMLRLSLQLEMGMFSAAIAGLVGMAFGMNLDSSLEEVRNHIYSNKSPWLSLIFLESVCFLGGHWTDDYHLWVAMETVAHFFRKEFGQSSSKETSFTKTVQQEIIIACSSIYNYID